MNIIGFGFLQLDKTTAISANNYYRQNSHPLYNFRSKMSTFHNPINTQQIKSSLALLFS